MTASASREVNVSRALSLARNARTITTATVKLLLDPSRLDQVLILSELLNRPTVDRMIQRLEQDDAGRTLLRTQPRIDARNVNFDALARLPEGTLGHEYVRFLRDNGITPDPFEELPDSVDPRAAYLTLRMRQTHDLWHVLTGYRADVRGEILLQAFIVGHTGAAFSVLVSVLGGLRWSLHWTGQLSELRNAYSRGKATRWLVAFPWEKHWSTPVPEVRRLLQCPALGSR